MPAAKENQLAKLEPTLVELDTFARDNNLAVLTENKGLFSASIHLANAMVQLKAMIPEEVMNMLMTLQGSPLGFKTDKDKTGGYPVETVRDVMIDMTIKGGFLLFQNEVNIISGQGYVTKDGFKGWFARASKAGLCTYPIINIGVPKIAGDGAIVPCSAECMKGGNKVSVSADIPVNGKGSDLLIGKATRKILARLFERVTNITVSDADVGDAITVETRVTTEAPPAVEPATEDQKAELCELLAGSEDIATDYLRFYKSISADAGFLALSAKQADKIIKRPADFLAAAKEHAATSAAK